MFILAASLFYFILLQNQRLAGGGNPDMGFQPPAIDPPTVFLFRHIILNNYCAIFRK